MHGKTSKIKHARIGLFKNMKNNFEATRYHSLVVDRKKFPKNLLITAETKNKNILCIGDNLNTDIKGANIQNFKSLFIMSGIHNNENEIRERRTKGTSAHAM